MHSDTHLDRFCMGRFISCCSDWHRMNAHLRLTAPSTGQIQSGQPLGQASKCCTYISADNLLMFTNAYVSGNVLLYKRHDANTWPNSCPDWNLEQRHIFKTHRNDVWALRTGSQENNSTVSKCKQTHKRRMEALSSSCLADFVHPRKLVRSTGTYFSYLTQSVLRTDCQLLVDNLVAFCSVNLLDKIWSSFFDRPAETERLALQQSICRKSGENLGKSGEMIPSHAFNVYMGQGSFLSGGN